ncbi:hypothetical protein ACQPYK_26305 [Streptosporangium sp. CA-135522]|uniref:hypothetical protein n=1 Tax=Streptosporangium sp. CA-135522 TaxID=3240072 RepID=UPI003D9133DD
MTEENESPGRSTRRGFLGRASALSGLIALAGTVAEVAQPSDAFAVVAGFRSCPKCQTLWSAAPPYGNCPAGGTHEEYGSWNYSVKEQPDGGAGQTDWRICAACECLWWSGTLAKACSGDPNGHRISSRTRPKSRYYLVEYGTVPSDGLLRQAGWKSCDNCSALYFAGPGAPPSRCPNGGAHVGVYSWAYNLRYTVS